MIARRFISALVIALVISGVFTFWLSRKFAKPHAEAPKVQQYVAATANLEAGEVLQAPKLKLVNCRAGVGGSLKSVPFRCVTRPRSAKTRRISHPGRSMPSRRMARASVSKTAVAAANSAAAASILVAA